MSRGYSLFAAPQDHQSTPHVGTTVHRDARPGPATGNNLPSFPTLPHALRGWAPSVAARQRLPAGQPFGPPPFPSSSPARADTENNSVSGSSGNPFPGRTALTSAITAEATTSFVPDGPQDCAICKDPLIVARPEGTGNVSTAGYARIDIYEGTDTSDTSASNPTIAQAEFAHAATKISSCGHVFGKACLDEWMRIKLTCPLCRKIVSQTASELLRCGAYSHQLYAHRQNRRVEIIDTPSSSTRSNTEDEDVGLDLDFSD